MSAPFKLDANDIVKTVEKVVIFALPMLLANTETVSKILADNGASPELSALVVSFIVYLGKRLLTDSRNVG